MNLTFEICIDSTEAAIAAASSGASRVELCAGLFEGGITPSLGLIETTLAAAPSIRVHVLIRPRGGDFIYDAHEVAAMVRDIKAARDAGAHGVVIGALTPEGEVDLATIESLVAAAGSMQITFHRAFDMAADPSETLETLIRLGCHRVLTSGQESSALEGAPLIADLVRQGGERIIVMAGGGITSGNAARIAEATGVHEMHFAAMVPVASAAVFRNQRAFMGDSLRQPEYIRAVTSRDMIVETMAAAAGTDGQAVAGVAVSGH
jgi:copper homeostasis protein